MSCGVWSKISPNPSAGRAQPGQGGDRSPLAGSCYGAGNKRVYKAWGWERGWGRSRDPLGQLHPCSLWSQPLRSGVTPGIALNPPTLRIPVPIALISPFSLYWHEDSRSSQVRDQIRLEASTLPKVCASSRPCTGPAGSVLARGAALPAPPCSGFLFVPAGNIDPVKNMIFGFAASGLNRCPCQGWVPEGWQGFIACHDLCWRWSGMEPSQPAPKETNIRTVPA